MPEDLVLQHPHVHGWINHVSHKVHAGPIDNAPALYCECGESAGDWAEVAIFIEVFGDAEMTVGDLWPDGDHPVPVTVEAVHKVLDRHRRDLIRDWVDLDASITVGRKTMSMHLWL